MRVIAGQLKGRSLKGPRSERIRPALDKVKQAIFNILGDIEGRTVLDLFAGTGSIGLEALSRRASRAVFADAGAEAIGLIRQNLVLCRCEGKGTVVRLRLPRDLPRLARRFEAFDLIFVDPPYDKNLVNPTLEAIGREKILAPGGTVVVEHSPREPVSPEEGLLLADQRKYGQTCVSFLGFPSGPQYVDSIREKSSSSSDEKFLADLRKWEKTE